MNLETVSAEEFGRSLCGLGLNVLVKSVPRTTDFLSAVFSMKVHRQSADFAIVSYTDQLFQLHADHTYHSHPLPSLLPENGARGAGVEFRLYQTDPDNAVLRADEHEHESTLLAPSTNKPHGLRECVILCESGYAWVASRALTDDEITSGG